MEPSVMSDIVIAYEKAHYPIEKPTVPELIELSCLMVRPYTTM
jgi:HTH-type transcriptional regulator/antitoxin HigA